MVMTLDQMIKDKDVIREIKEGPVKEEQEGQREEAKFSSPFTDGRWWHIYKCLECCNSVQ